MIHFLCSNGRRHRGSISPPPPTFPVSTLWNYILRVNMWVSPMWWDGKINKTWQRSSPEVQTVFVCVPSARYSSEHHVHPSVLRPVYSPSIGSSPFSPHNNLEHHHPFTSCTQANQTKSENLNWLNKIQVAFLRFDPWNAPPSSDSHCSARQMCHSKTVSSNSINLSPWLFSPVYLCVLGCVSIRALHPS